MTNFAQIMHDWQRMCNYFEKQYDYACCEYCPLESCGAIWEMSYIKNWEEFEKKITDFVKAHPEPKYPTWREYLKKIGVVIERNIKYTENGPEGQYIVGKDNASILNEKADCPIPDEIATALGLEPQHD